MPRFLVALVALVVLAVPTAARAQSAAPITQAQFDTLSPVLADAKVLDAVKPVKSQLNRYTSACRKLGQGDPLIAGYRAICRAEGSAFAAGLAVPTCKSAPRCRARLTRYSNGLRAQMRAMRAFNTFIATAIPDADCRRALRVNATVLKTLTKIDKASRNVLKTLRTGPATAINKGVAAYYAIDRTPLFDHTGRSDAFQAGCQ